MRKFPVDAITEHDVQLRIEHPSAKWVIGWEEDGERSRDCEDRVNAVARRICSHSFYTRPMYTYIAFDDYDDAMLVFVAL